MPVYDNDDKTRTLIANVVLWLVVAITLASLYFQFLERAFNLPPIVDKMVSGVFLTIAWYYFKRTETQARRFREVGSSRLLLLLIEDDDANIDMLRWGFDKRDCEYSLQVEKCAEDGLKWLMRSMIKPDVIILDLNLGEGKMTGQEFLRKLKSNRDYFEIPVIILTGSHREDVDDQGAIELARFFVERGQGIDSLIEAIESANPYNDRKPCQDFINENLSLRKSNHDLRNNIASLLAAIDLQLTGAKMKQITDNVKLSLRAEKKVDGTISLRNVDPKDLA